MPNRTPSDTSGPNGASVSGPTRSVPISRRTENEVAHQHDQEQHAEQREPERRADRPRRRLDRASGRRPWWPRQTPVPRVSMLAPHGAECMRARDRLHRGRAGRSRRGSATSPLMHRAATIGTAGPAGHGKTALVHALADRAATSDDGSESTAEHGHGRPRLRLPRHRRASASGSSTCPATSASCALCSATLHGIDLVLLVVAADEGVRPADRGVRRHPAPARRARDRLSPSPRRTSSRRRGWTRSAPAIAALRARHRASRSAPVHAVSSVTGAGIAALRDEVLRAGRAPRERARRRLVPDVRRSQLRRAGTRPDGHRNRRSSGTLRSGDAVALRPGALAGDGRRDPGARRDGRPAPAQDSASPCGSASIDRKHVRRGLVLADPRVEFTTDRFDCRLEVRPGARAPLRSFDRVEIDVGTVETAGIVVVLEPGDALAPRRSRLLPDRARARDDPRARRPLRAASGGRGAHHRRRDRAAPVRGTPFAAPSRISPSVWRGSASVRCHRGCSPFLELLPELAAPLAYAAQGARLHGRGAAARGGRHARSCRAAGRGRAAGPTRRATSGTSSSPPCATVLQRFHRAHSARARHGPGGPARAAPRARAAAPPRRRRRRLAGEAVVVREGEPAAPAKHRPGSARRPRSPRRR